MATRPTASGRTSAPTVQQPDLFTAPAQPAEPGYRGPQVCAVVGITYRQLDYWARTDLLRPSIEDAKGSGSQRVYSYRDLVALKVIKKLIDAGLSLQSVRKAIDYLRDHLGDELASANLVIDGGNVLLATDNNELVDIIRGGQGVLNIVAMGSVVDELDTSISDLAPDSKSDSAVAPQRKAAGG
ncbi:MAG: MerR family transcriptional regulator [Acidimicrobiia bacterium]